MTAEPVREPGAQFVLRPRPTDPRSWIISVIAVVLLITGLVGPRSTETNVIFFGGALLIAGYNALLVLRIRVVVDRDTIHSIDPLFGHKRLARSKAASIVEIRYGWEIRNASGGLRLFIRSWPTDAQIAELAAVVGVPVIRQ